MSALDFANAVVVAGFRMPALIDAPHGDGSRAARRPDVRHRRPDEQHADQQHVEDPRHRRHPDPRAPVPEQGAPEEPDRARRHDHADDRPPRPDGRVGRAAVAGRAVSWARRTRRFRTPRRMSVRRATRPTSRRRAPGSGRRRSRRLRRRWRSRRRPRPPRARRGAASPECRRPRRRQLSRRSRRRSALAARGAADRPHRPSFQRAPTAAQLVSRAGREHARDRARRRLLCSFPAAVESASAQSVPVPMPTAPAAQGQSSYPADRRRVEQQKRAGSASGGELARAEHRRRPRPIAAPNRAARSEGARRTREARAEGRQAEARTSARRTKKPQARGAKLDKERPSARPRSPRERRESREGSQRTRSARRRSPTRRAAEEAQAAYQAQLEKRKAEAMTRRRARIRARRRLALRRPGVGSSRRPFAVSGLGSLARAAVLSREGDVMNMKQTAAARPGRIGHELRVHRAGVDGVPERQHAGHRRRHADDGPQPGAERGRRWCARRRDGAALRRLRRLLFRRPGRHQRASPAAARQQGDGEGTSR